MHQQNRGNIDFEAGRIEDHTFAMKQGYHGYSPEDKHTERPELTLGNVGCIPHFPNNISSLLGTSIRKNNDNLNTMGSVNYVVPQPQPHPV